jgi:hypothetical protein
MVALRDQGRGEPPAGQRLTAGECEFVGARLQLEITNVDSPYLAPSRIPSVTQISDVRLELPIR